MQHSAFEAAVKVGNNADKDSCMVVKASMVFLSGSESQEGSVMCPLALCPFICSTVHALVDASGCRYTTTCMWLSYPDTTPAHTTDIMERDGSQCWRKVTYASRYRVIRRGHPAGNYKSSL